MRNLPSNVSKHVFKRIQTKSSGSEISTNLIIARPETTLKHKEFVDIQKITSLTGGSTFGTAIAVEHSKWGVNNTNIYTAYTHDGKITIMRAKPKYRIEEHHWIVTDNQIDDVDDAMEVELCFDGTMPIKKAGDMEFITEKDPWVFWINFDRECYAQKLGHPETRFRCAEANCMGISAIRATWSEIGRFDFGLCLFMLLNGTIYYRQYINGEWYDAAPINFGPENTVYTHIRVTRTWDYRVCIQAKDREEGKIYEMFSQFEGIGTRNIEHVKLDSIKAEGSTTGIKYHQAKSDDNNTTLTGTGVTDSRVRWGQPVYVISGNTIDDGTGNFGKLLHVRFDHPFVEETVAASGESWTLTDSNGLMFNSTECFATSNTEVTIRFRNFNLAVGECTLHYEPGTIATEIVASRAFDYIFTPEGLDKDNIHIPKVTEVYNE